MAKGGFDVQALPARPDQDPGRRRVHEQSQERDDEHPAAEDLGRVVEPHDRLPDDPAADQHECQPVDECRQDLRPLEAEAAHRRGRSAGQRHGHEGQRDRDVVGQHVTRVREEGEAVRPDSPGDLDDRERQGEQEHPEERAARCAPVVVGMSPVRVVRHRHQRGYDSGRVPRSCGLLPDSTTVVRRILYPVSMAKVVVQFTCSECGATAGRWLGRCPGCGTFGTLVEELHGSDGRPASGRRPDARASRRRAGRRGGTDPDGSARARSRPRRRTRPRVARPRRRRAGRRQVDAAALRSRCDRPLRALRTARHRRGVRRAGPSSRRPTGRCGRRVDPRRDGARGGVRDPRARPAGRLRDRLGADALRRRARVRAGLGGAGAGGGVEAPPRREAERGRDGARRARDEGRRSRRPEGPRAPRRLRPPVRRRPVPRAPRAPRGQEPVRVDERARGVRDDVRGPRRGPRPLGALRRDAARRGRRSSCRRTRGDPADPARDPGIGLAHRPGDAASRRRRASTRRGSR